MPPQAVVRDVFQRLAAIGRVCRTGVNHGAKVGLGVHRVAKLQAFGAFQREGHEAISDAFLNQDAFDGGAALARVLGGPGHGQIGGFGEVGVDNGPHPVGQSVLQLSDKGFVNFQAPCTSTPGRQLGAKGADRIVHIGQSSG